MLISIMFIMIVQINLQMVCRIFDFTVSVIRNRIVHLSDPDKYHGVISSLLLEDSINIE